VKAEQLNISFSITNYCNYYVKPFTDTLHTL